jgi:ADP-ribose pyrophosphatase YjhB (NUDIX family)
VDLAPFRKRYGRFPLEHRDWPVDAGEFAAFAKRGRDPSGAAALVWNKDRSILLVRERSALRWATPGGFAERGETPEECVLREVQEEAGVEVRITGLTKVVVCHVAVGGQELAYTFFQFEADHVRGRPQPGAEIGEAAWFDRLPDDLHFRADYVEVWLRGRPTV